MKNFGGPLFRLRKAPAAIRSTVGAQRTGINRLANLLTAAAHPGGVSQGVEPEALQRAGRSGASRRGWRRRRYVLLERTREEIGPDQTQSAPWPEEAKGDGAGPQRAAGPAVSSFSRAPPAPTIRVVSEELDDGKGAELSSRQGRVAAQGVHALVSACVHHLKY